MHFFYEKREKKIMLGKIQHLAFGAHLHSHIELVYIKKGTAHAYAGGKDCRLSKGDFFISFPNTIHYYDDCSEDIDVLIAIFAWEDFPEYKNEFTSLIPKSPKIKDVSPVVNELLEKACAIKGSYRNQILHGILSAVLGMIFQKAEFESVKNYPENVIQAIINYCRENYKQNITLKDVSFAVHISEARISHIFGEKLRINFRTFLNSFRLIEAEKLLVSSDLNITQIAMESGFENVRTFNRAFLMHFGCSPRNYKNNVGI